MAKMYPSIFPSENTVERIVFEKLQKELDDAWSVHYDSYLTCHVKHAVGQADFILVSTKAVIVLEVKGCRVERPEGSGKWIYHYENKSKSPVGPHDQALMNRQSLLTYLKKNHPDLSYGPFGCCVVFPNHSFDFNNQEWPNSLTCDQSEFHNTNFKMSSFIDRVVGHWVAASPANNQNFTTSQAHKINAILSPVEKVTLRKVVSDSKTLQSFQLTSLQGQLSRMLDVNPRMLIEGHAGSGKTLVARQHAQNLAKIGARVLFLCWSKPLSSHIERELGSSVVTLDLRSFLSQKFTDPSVNQLTDVDSVIEYCKRHGDHDRKDEFDVLIVDEGQDILNEAIFDVVFSSLRNGYNSQFYIFMDPQQDVVYSNRRKLPKFIANIARFALTENCRNTQKIVNKTKYVTKYAIEQTLPVAQGILEPIFRDGKFQINQVASLINQIVGAYSDIDFSSTTILCHEVDLAEKLRHYKLCEIEVSRYELRKSDSESTDAIAEVNFVAPGSAEPAPNSLTISSAEEYKGLEAMTIIYIGPDEFNEDSIKKVYVAMTRARAALFVSLNKNLVSQFMEL